MSAVINNNVKNSSVKPNLSVQWHLTQSCTNRCRHCYMGDINSVKNKRINNDLDLGTLISILESIESFANKRDINIHYIFTGGDPLLRNDFTELLFEVKRYNRSFSILGNPETINRDKIRLMSKLGLKDFQLSIDGVQQTHDWVRGVGAYERMLEAAEILSNEGVMVRGMFTLYPFNTSELIPLMNELMQSKVDYFTFDIGIPIGSALNFENNVITKNEMREIAVKYLLEKERIKSFGGSIKFGEKNSLLLLARLQDDKFKIPENNIYECLGGCHIGWTSTTILNDGSVLACRRMPITVGKLPEQSFEEIWLGSPKLREFRRKENWVKCGKCELYAWCRGCSALTYAINGNPFLENPICWKDDVATKSKLKILSGNNNWDMNCTMEEEFMMLKKHINFATTKGDILKRHTFRIAYTNLIINKKAKTFFLSNPDRYAAMNNIEKEEVELLHHIFTTKERFET